MSQILLRTGQAQFRRELLVTCGDKCAISDCDAEQALDAAHIPYRGLKTVNDAGSRAAERREPRITRRLGRARLARNSRSHSVWQPRTAIQDVSDNDEWITDIEDQFTGRETTSDNALFAPWERNVILAKEWARRVPRSSQRIRLVDATVCPHPRATESAAVEVI